ncbi:3-deoxy-manno-octulosonate cytidylyltransferase [Streptomyces sp. NPDC056500]|uniref:3-deoxy-manno-octulosonate cytidylyltransferase n=1 Tax=Streptomyces sp. NPDC056500 TaxID=3345840 RepID=UPI0036C52C56
MTDRCLSLARRARDEQSCRQDFLVLGVIPARFASTRLPGKVLLDIGGRTMLEHVWRRAMLARRLDRVLIATDDERIATTAELFGADVTMTSPMHTCGTERVAEAASSVRSDIVVNIQGDEPLLDPAWIDQLVPALHHDTDAAMATIACPLHDQAQISDPNVVKVVSDAHSHALYFSRHPIPHDRHHSGVTRYRHIGLYAYRTAFLTEFTRLPPSPLEQAEGLEQLRALHHGHNIHVTTVTAGDDDGCGVDTIDDLQHVRRIFTDRSVAGASDEQR